ncbi:ATP-binding cassette domain-containing protein [Marinovum algicola]|uniref:ATP-binding cassette domain-containing protein n=1 Tax=Marinovum algicola TaxID=42444 RepID=UPI0024BBA447|nr:ATP-binding cassette domain-containing protein [Marinovum algicola]
MQSLVSIQGLQKSFAGVVALSDATLEIRPGEVHALIGQNGAGKSTLIKCLTGVHRRDGGEVWLDGQEFTATGPRHAQSAGIATIYQELNLVPLRSVTENVVMGAEPRNRLGLIDWRAAHARTREVLSRFGIEIDVKERLGAYPSAIQQLVAIAPLRGDVVGVLVLGLAFALGLDSVLILIAELGAVAEIDRVQVVVEVRGLGLGQQG